MEERLKELETKLSDHIDANNDFNKNLAEAINGMNQNILTIFDDLNSIKSKLRDIEVKVDNFHKDTSSNFNNVDTKLVDISTQITKINIVTGYEAEFDNLPPISS